MKNYVNNERLLSADECKNTIRSILLVIYFLLSFHNIYPQNSNITFEHYSIDQGMYETNIFTVIQDRTGYLWFGTWGGIERYDGYNFTAYRKELGNPNSIQTQFVNTLYEDKDGNIWVGTDFGLEKLNKTTGNFTHYLPCSSSTHPERDNIISSICEDKFGMLWVGTRDGLYNFDKKSEKFICIRNDDKNPESIGSNDISAIIEDQAGSIWFGNSKGLDKLDRESGKFMHFWNDPNNKSEWTNYFVNTLFEDKSGIIWLGTRKGVVAFDQNARTFTPYIKEGQNSISSICEDESGQLWFGCWDSGLYSLDKKTKKLINYLHDDKNSGSLSSNIVTSVCYDRSGTIWISTRGGGANKINRIKQPFKKYLFNEISHIVNGNHDMLWIGTSKGWNKFNPKTEQIIPYSFGKDFLVAEEKSGDLWLTKESGGIYKCDVKGRVTNYFDSSGREFDEIVNCLLQTPDSIVWIGTVEGGVYKIAPNRNLIKKILQTGWVMDIYLDSSDLLWIGSIESALICYDPSKNIVINKFYFDPGNPGSIKSNVVFKILGDNSGALYFATNKGLGIYNRSTKEFNFFNERNGLPHDILWTFLRDDSGNFWIATRKGISKFNPATKQFQNYDVSYGLPENGFYLNGDCKTQNGEMYFAAPNAVVRFHPDSIKNNSFIPPIEITSVKKFEEPIPISGEIDLSYKENFLSFEFIALSYVSPERNQYAHKMEGVDKDWVYSGTRRFASYPNLEPGEYVFRVRGSNNDGVWNEAGTSIAIIILPPFWRTWWAYLTYTGIFILSLYGIRRYELNRISYKNQGKLDKAVLKEKEETEKIKSAFFANISHEFRTPLTLILGPAEKIEKNQSSNPVKDAGIITRNSKRLMQLVNQLLDLSKLDAGKLKLEASPGNIVSFIKGIALSFESLSESRDIMLKIKSEKEFIEIYFDREKMLKILSNLLSNALKFTPENGSIIITLNETLNETVTIKIKNIGIGIPKVELPKLFDRFYQVDSSQTKEYEGTGIGLALVKELVELHHGSITVDSEIGDVGKTGWTEFTISLPIGKAHLRNEEIVRTDEKDYQQESSVEEEEYLNSRALDNSNTVTDETKTIILVVEDNYDMREYIKESLINNYSIEEAVNGEQGVRLAEKIIPDLIISDLMMPKLDGNELTRILKKDERTSHIPIILLTAKSGQENKIIGLQTGADDYLTKPFDLQELRVKVENLISVRKKLQEKFSKGEFLSKRTDKKLKNIDEKFLAKVLEVIEKHISEEEFSIEECSSEVGFSRTHFHKKLRALVGKSPSQYVRTVRLYRAKQLIEEEKGNVSEIAYSVGFSSPAYFSRCFREEFGYPPSDIIS